MGCDKTWLEVPGTVAGWWWRLHAGRDMLVFNTCNESTHHGLTTIAPSPPTTYVLRMPGLNSRRNFAQRIVKLQGAPN
jgi:hypothetical protein